MLKIGLMLHKDIYATWNATVPQAGGWALLTIPNPSFASLHRSLMDMGSFAALLNLP